MKFDTPIYLAFAVVIAPLSLILDFGLLGLVSRICSFFLISSVLKYFTIFVHELGHYIVLRYHKFKVRIFQIGEGKILFKYQKNSSSTIFLLGSIPGRGRCQFYCKKSLSWKKVISIFYAGFLFQFLTLSLCLVLALSLADKNPPAFWKTLETLFCLSITFAFIFSSILLLLGQLGMWITIFFLTLFIVTSIKNLSELISEFKVTEISIPLEVLYSNEFYLYSIFYFSLIYLIIRNAFLILNNCVAVPLDKMNIVKIKVKAKKKTKSKVAKKGNHTSSISYNDGTHIHFTVSKILKLRKIQRFNQQIYTFFT